MEAFLQRAMQFFFYDHLATRMLYVKQILHLRFYNQRKIFQSKIVHLNPEFPQGLGKSISQLSVYAMHYRLIACDNDAKLKTKMRI